MRWFLGLLSLFFFISLSAVAETSLWRVSKGANELYIGGTVHVLSASDYPLPKAYDVAFNKATKLVFETDTEATQDPAFGQSLMSRMMYTDGRSLKDELSRETYQKFEAFSVARGLPMAMFQQMRPPLAVLTLMIVELQRLGIAEAGVDAYYYQRAKAENKIIGQLETPQQQLEFIVNLGKGREDDFVSYSLKDMQELGVVMGDLVSAWRSGDTNKMVSLALTEMRRDFPGIYQQLLVSRNHNWLPKIEKMINDPGTELVLVGALHLVGDDGVLQLLRNKGYKLEQQ
ncbi:MAG: TraB/GumN family protein [Ectothiorhodospiraceae bacterium]|nr:TraB/GumN family protein [Ectothiorhodospiraceae bacterium]